MTRTGVGPTSDSRHCAPRPPAARRLVALMCGAVVLLTAAALAGDLLSPVLLDRQPLLLLALNARTVYLVALADELPFAVLLVVAVSRLCAADPVHFVLGRHAQAKAGASSSTGRLRFVARRLPAGSNPLWLAAIGLSPTGKTMFVAGAAGVPSRAAAVANVIGTTGRVVLIWNAGRALPTMGDSLSGFVPWVAVPAGMAAVVLMALRCRRTGSRLLAPAGAA